MVPPAEMKSGSDALLLLSHAQLGLKIPTLKQVKIDTYLSVFLSRSRSRKLNTNPSTLIQPPNPETRFADLFNLPQAENL
jgi:hypothetical protein